MIWWILRTLEVIGVLSVVVTLFLIVCFALFVYGETKRRREK